METEKQLSVLHTAPQCTSFTNSAHWTKEWSALRKRLQHKLRVRQILSVKSMTKLACLKYFPYLCESY